MSNPARVLRWTALRDKKAALKEVSESFLIHRHDLSPATQDNYRLQFRLYDTWVAAQLGVPSDCRPALEPGHPEPTFAAKAWWMATRGTKWLLDRSTDLVPSLARLALAEFRDGPVFAREVTR